MAGASLGPRVSAHVVPKPMMDDEEKTTIDPQWDDGSTTSEQHKVSQRLRALELGEPSTAESLSPAAAPPPIVANLVVTHGSDLGRVFEIRSGKPFTIGRSLDCDVVLTDIAVSRKHFDLRNEDGWWVIADRGSGNGTLVNNDPKNGPFQLVNGDVIEVGTTTLRFDCRPTEVESEVSTISGKRQAPEMAPVAELPYPPVLSSPAPVGPQALLAASRSRLPAMPTRPLVLGPHSPTLLGVDPQDSAHLLAALAGGPTPHALGGTIDSISPVSRRPPADVARVARVPTHVPSAPSASAAAGNRPTGSQPHISTRGKIAVAAGAAVLLATVVAIALVVSRKKAGLGSDTASLGVPTAKFRLPVAELKASRKSAPAASAAAPARATKPTVPAASGAETAAIAPTVPPDTDRIVETVVEVKPKPTKLTSERRSTTKLADKSSAEEKADSLYRAERFNEAADALRTFARTADRSTKRALFSKAKTYASFGKAYVQSMTNDNPGQAFSYLRSATNYDRTLGGAFEDEIAAKMKEVAPKAAVSFVAADELRDAHLAVEAAERAGASSDPNVALVKRKLETAAAKLYSEAMGDLQDNPSEAKARFRQIKDIVDSNSPWHARASTQLAGM